MPATTGAIIIGIRNVVTSTFSQREPLSDHGEEHADDDLQRQAHARCT